MRHTTIPILICLFVFLSSPASAHQTTLVTTLISADGSTSPIVLDAKSRVKLSLSSGKGGVIKFKLTKALDSNGQRITAAGNSLEIDAIVKGVPQQVSIPFDINNGNAKVNNFPLNLVKPDIIQILGITLEDQSGETFATLGVRILP